jgi:hypothetical protein
MVPARNAPIPATIPQTKNVFIGLLRPLILSVSMNPKQEPPASRAPQKIVSAMGIRRDFLAGAGG